MLLCEKTPTLEANRMFSVDRDSRQGDKFLGRLQLDQETLSALRSDRIGLLFEKFLKLETMLGRLVQLVQQNSFGRIVVVYPSKESGAYVYSMLTEMGYVIPYKKNPSTWSLGSLLFTSIEALPRIRECEDVASDAMGFSMIILLDPTCMVYKARSMYLGNGSCHDRPQLIVNALNDLATDGNEPLFVIMTCRTAVSLDTDKLARTYARETWWFCDGPTMRLPSLNR